MPIPQIMDLLIVTLAGYFLVHQLHRREVSRKTIDGPKVHPYYTKGPNSEFIWVLLVLMIVLTVIDLFVPYGTVLLLPVAACGFCCILLDGVLLVIARWHKLIAPPQEERQKECAPPVEKSPLPKEEEKEEKVCSKDKQDPYSVFY